MKRNADDLKTKKEAKKPKTDERQSLLLLEELKDKLPETDGDEEPDSAFEFRDLVSEANENINELKGKLSEIKELQSKVQKELRALKEYDPEFEDEDQKKKDIQQLERVLKAISKFIQTYAL